MKTLTIETLLKRSSVLPWSRHRRAGSERGLATKTAQPNYGVLRREQVRPRFTRCGRSHTEPGPVRLPRPSAFEAPQEPLGQASRRDTRRLTGQDGVIGTNVTARTPWTGIGIRFVLQGDCRCLQQQVVEV